MFLLEERFDYKYAPILSLSLSEMEALENLPEKDKDLILPIFPLKGWMSSQLLDNSLKKIKKTIGDRRWIASFDKSYLSDNKDYLLKGTYPREVFYQLVELKNLKMVTITGTAFCEISQRPFQLFFLTTCHNSKIK